MALYHDENFDRRSERLTCSVVWAFGVRILLTSGSPIVISVKTAVAGGISFSHRNSGPVNQFDVRSWLILEPLEATSAGFLSVATNCHCCGVVLRCSFYILFDTNV